MASDDSNRRTCSIRVEVRCPALNLQKKCSAYHVEVDRVFVEDLPSLTEGVEVEVRFPGDRNDPLWLNCTVQETVGDLAFLRFPELNGNEMAKLEALLCPNWDGTDLLEGLLILSRRLPATSLEDWMRLTSIIVKCRPGAITECIRSLDQSMPADFLTIRNEGDN